MANRLPTIASGLPKGCLDRQSPRDWFAEATRLLYGVLAKTGRPHHCGERLRVRNVTLRRV